MHTHFKAGALGFAFFWGGGQGKERGSEGAEQGARSVREHARLCA
jgi:hypothetical protein